MHACLAGAEHPWADPHRSGRSLAARGGVVARARAAGFRWPLPAELDDAALDAGRGIDIVDPDSGTVTGAPFFVAALGASSFTFAEACDGQDLRAWIAAHIHTFAYIDLTIMTRSVILVSWHAPTRSTRPKRS